MSMTAGPWPKPYKSISLEHDGCGDAAGRDNAVHGAMESPMIKIRRGQNRGRRKLDWLDGENQGFDSP
jgi:hypothetical protein